MAATPGSRVRWLWAAGVAAACGLTAAFLALMEPARPPIRHISPDGRYAVILISDTSLGQIEHLRVLADPDAPGARLVLDHPGEVPLRFLGWRDGATAELETAPHDGHGPRRLLLRCAGSSCQLDPAPGP